MATARHGPPGSEIRRGICCFQRLSHDKVKSSRETPVGGQHWSRKRPSHDGVKSSRADPHSLLVERHPGSKRAQEDPRRARKGAPRWLQKGPTNRIKIRNTIPDKSGIVLQFLLDFRGPVGGPKRAWTKHLAPRGGYPGLLRARRERAARGAGSDAWPQRIRPEARTRDSPGRAPGANLPPSKIKTPRARNSKNPRRKTIADF